MGKLPVKKTSKASPRKAADSGASGRPSSGGRAAAKDEALPSEEEITAAFAPVRDFATNASAERLRGFLHSLAKRPPQVILIEGGSSESRLAAAHYWTLLLNCDRLSSTSSASSQKQADLSLPGLPGIAPPLPEQIEPDAPAMDAGPCCSCPTCIRMVTHLHRDCFFLDGTAGSIKIDDVRALRSVLGEPPREAECRTVIFREAQALGEAAANSLLKSFEEPRPHTSFVMLVPQRERLLPTLVSRSLVLTLPWPSGEDRQKRDSMAPWEAALCTFLMTGRDLFDKSALKGAIDAALAHDITNMCRRALAECIRLKSRQHPVEGSEGLERLLMPLPEARLRILDEALAECQESLIYGVNPTLVVEWLATRLYLLLPRR